MTKLLKEVILQKRGYANAQTKNFPISEQDSISIKTQVKIETSIQR
jgi:hypothetical protein